MSPICKERTINDFKGKTVMLTGATGGLGKSFAMQLSACGVSTLLLSARKADLLKDVAAECRAVAPNKDVITIETIVCDLADPESVAKAAKEALEKCPQIDVLINNGGVSSRSRFIDTKPDVDQRVMQINFLSGAALAKALVPGMMERGWGRILWISSVQGLLGIPERTSYTASKFAVQGYCEALRAELATAGVVVHCVSPGYIRTNLSLSAITGDGGSYGKMDATTAAGADPTEVAVAILDRTVAGEEDFVIAATFSAIIAIWLRFLFPSLLRYLLIKRYEKSQKIKED